MDNRVSSIIKRSMKVLTGYITAFIIFCVLSVSILGLAQGDTPEVIPWLSFLTFVILFFLVYVEMRNIGFKENRPQYKIYPSKFKGLLYGAIGIAPIGIVQFTILTINVSETYEGFRRRIFQLVSGPLYWIAKILGNELYDYFVALIFVIIIALLGYLAGHHKFYLLAWLKRTLGTKRNKKD